MVFPPKQRNMLVAAQFPLFQLGDSFVHYVNTFKYLGHVLDNDNKDNADIQREISNMFIRVNILIRRFFKCSRKVKLVLFKSYCLCMYDTALWQKYKIDNFNKLRSCYHRCIKLFFGFRRMDSMTNILGELGLPTLDVLMTNA